MKYQRKSMAVAAGIAILALAACGSDGGDTDGAASTGNESGDSSTESPDGAAGEVTLDILSWWTAGGEAEALDAVVDGFATDHANITIENSAVAGGAGANSQAVLSTRLQGGDPPGVFQAQGGADLLRWQEAGYLADLTHLYEENDWYSVMPEEIVNMNAVDGKIYGVPINIHRNNLIFYNKAVFDEHNITPPETFEDFLSVAAELDAAGVVPLALGSKTSRWATLVFEHVLTGEIGVEAANQLWAGDGDFDSEGVRAALDKFDQVLDYVNDNHSALDWQEAADLVIAGEAAMHIMGDWETGYFDSKDWVPNEDYAWIQFPNDEQVFSIVNDSLAVPEEYEDKATAETFLNYFGSVDGQHDFNKLKGSIPARTDVDTSDYSAYSDLVAEDFKSAKIYIGLASGSATSAGFVSRVDDVINQFVTQRDADAVINVLVDSQDLLASY